MLDFEVLTLALVVASSPPPDMRYDREIAAAIEDVGDVHHVPAALVKAVITQ